MPQIVFGPQLGDVDGSTQKAVYAFLAKLQKDDTAPGLHIEPINNCIDPRVRTGRVNDFYRAVMVKVQGSGAEAHYVYLGTLPHDDAIEQARKVKVSINPRNGIAELIKADQDAEAAAPKPPACWCKSPSARHTHAAAVVLRPHRRTSVGCAAGSRGNDA